MSALAVTVASVSVTVVHAQSAIVAEVSTASTTFVDAKAGSSIVVESSVVTMIGNGTRYDPLAVVVADPRAEQTPKALAVPVPLELDAHSAEPSP